MDLAQNHINRGYENDVELNPRAVKRQTDKTRRRIDKRLVEEAVVQADAGQSALCEFANRRIVR